MPDLWEARITRITINSDQSQIFESVFVQQIDTEPDLQQLIDHYGPSVHNPPADLMMVAIPGGPPVKAIANAKVG